jgi:hypothetical protein
VFPEKETPVRSLGMASLSHQEQAPSASVNFTPSLYHTVLKNERGFYEKYEIFLKTK